MELRHLRVFLVLAEELHFGRSAARLRLAQSAVSQTLKALEEELGSKLLERTQRRVSLTTAGREFARHAAAALEEVERAQTAARLASSGAKGRLSLSFTMMAALTVLPRAVAAFRARYPGVHVVIEQGGSTEQFDTLARGVCDMAFMSFKREAPPYATEVVEKSTLVAVVPEGHAFARADRVALTRFADEPCILLSARDEPGIRARLARRFAELGIDLRVVLETDQLETMLAFVSVGLGVSVAPAFVDRIAMKGVRTVRIDPAIPCGISAVWDARTLSPVGARFLDVLRAERDAEAASPRAPAARR